jgi:hypothetical protein
VLAQSEADGSTPHSFKPLAVAEGTRGGCLLLQSIQGSGAFIQSHDQVWC